MEIIGIIHNSQIPYCKSADNSNLIVRQQALTLQLTPMACTLE